MHMLTSSRSCKTPQQAHVRQSAPVLLQGAGNVSPALGAAPGECTIWACVCLMSLCPTSKRAGKNLFRQIFTKDLNLPQPQNILHPEGGCTQGWGEHGTQGGTSGTSRTQMKEIQDPLKMCLHTAAAVLLFLHRPQH